MKILSAADTRKADAFTIENEPVASIDLMERASLAFTDLFTQHIRPERKIIIFCATGNNGGDGLAVARMLIDRNYQVETYLVNFAGEGSPDFLINLDRLKKINKPGIILTQGDFPEVPANAIIIDAIFGSGLTRPVEGLYAEVIHGINDTGCQVFALDIASGLFADNPAGRGAITRPAVTITLHMPKLAFFIPENEEYVGQWAVVDIGLDQEYINSIDSPYTLVTENLVRQMIPRRRKFAHKGDFGKAIMLCGGLGKMGAAVLGARACMRTGAGLLTMHVPQCGYEIMQTSVPEAMVNVDIQKDYISQFPDLTPYNTIGIGPGIGMHPDTVRMLYKLLENYTMPIILDADAINIIGKNRFLLEKLPPGSILTPHLKEFERITEIVPDHFRRLEVQREFSIKYQVIVVLKGAYSSISMPDGRIFFNSTGNPGMATGGSGDVLTGMLTSLLAQNYPPSHAAILGTYLHGLSGDLAEREYGQQSLVATDIIDKIPGAYQMIKK